MIKLDLTLHEVYRLHDILLALFHKTDCNKPVHSLLGYHDFILIGIYSWIPTTNEPGPMWTPRALPQSIT